MDTRLKEKDGMQSTFSRVKVVVNATVSIWVTLAMSPLGSLTEMWTMEVIEVKNWSEWTMWSVAPLSRIQSVEQRWEASTWETKTEYSKEWEGNLGRWVEKGVKELILDISCPWKSKEGWVIIVATWWTPEANSCDAWVPKWFWELSKPRSYWYSARVRLKNSLHCCYQWWQHYWQKEDFHLANPCSWTCSQVDSHVICSNCQQCDPKLHNECTEVYQTRPY